MTIPGLHCPSCISLIKDISSEFPAITKVDVDLTTKHVILEHTDAFDIAKWKQEIESLGDSYRINEGTK